MKKNIFAILACLMVLVGCGNTNQQSANEPTKTADLIENINKYEADNAEVEVAEEEPAVSEEEIELAMDEPADGEGENKETSDVNQPSEVKTVNIKAVGDIMAHNIQNQYAYNRGGGVYDFTDSFVYVQDFLTDSDIAIGNYETTTNPNLPYAGFPQFNTPAAYIDALKDAGFDILTTANNHSLDTELEGLYTTIDAIEAAGLDYVGSHREGEETILLKDIDGVKVAFLAYTYGANGRDNLLVPREEVAELNYLYDEGIEADIKRAKTSGADFVVVYPHWGIEYQSYPDQRQIDLARNMIEWGADVVIGNHPHVVQPSEWYTAADGREGFIAYALGNFISYQNLETVNDIRTEQSVAYDITLEKDLIDDTTVVKSVEAYPIWVGLQYNDYGPNIQTRIAADFLEGGKYSNDVDPFQVNRIQQAQDMTTETVNVEVN